MTVSATQAAILLRSAISRVDAIEAPRRHATFDHEFTGSQTTVTLPIGWQPYAAYLDGARQREGAGNDVTFAYDGFAWSVVWAVAPSNVSVAIIDCWSAE